MPEERVSCVEPSKGPLDIAGKNPAGAEAQKEKEEQKMTVMVGKQAPDFEATAFVEGGFKNVKLSDSKGQWVVLCFYPGDFTFV